jgi:alcohol dehydrogenase (cytochrome c)
MKKIFALLLMGCCATVQAQTADELLNEGKNTENVTLLGTGYDMKMFSPLKQINKSNIKRLVPLWTFSLSNEMGELSQPTIYNGVMYVVNGNWTFAIDVGTGRQIWRTPVSYDRGALRMTTGGAYMRGAATIYNGKLFRQTIDGHVLALDMKTGKELWKTKFGEWKESYAGIVAPAIVNGVLISGMAGGDRTARGFVDGYDPETGKYNKKPVDPNYFINYYKNHDGKRITCNCGKHLTIRSLKYHLKNKFIMKFIYFSMAPLSRIMLK